MTTYQSDSVRTLYLDQLNDALETFFSMEGPRGKDELTGKGEGALRTLVSVFANLQAYHARMTALIEKDWVVGSPDLPKTYARRTLIDRAAEDTEVILRALTQRIPPLKDTLEPRLRLADRLAFAALTPVMSEEVGGRLPDEAAMLRPTTAVTYFQKATSVRVIPYAPVALIGVPFSSVTCYQDLLAIPHEIGHYVYWHEPLARGSLNGSLARHFWDQPAWVSAWQEEIFADVYGMLVAGPYMAINFQEILADTKREQFITDDGEHPVSLARAYVFTAVLRAVSYDAVADEIDTMWQNLVKKTYGSTYKAFVGDQQLPLKTIVGHIDTVVRRIVNFDLPHVKQRAAGTWSWDKDTTGSGVVDLARYKANFEDYVRANFEDDVAPVLSQTDTGGTQAAAPPEPPILKVEGKTVSLVGQEQGSRKLHSLGKTGSKLDEFLDSAITEKRQIGPAIWYQLLSSGGWTTGPGDVITSGK